MHLEHVQPPFVCQSWPAVAELLREGLSFSGGEYSLDQLQFMLVRGEHHLLALLSEDDRVVGVATVIFQNYPAVRVAYVSCLAGAFITTPPCFELLADFARSYGATRIAGGVRESVARLLKGSLGFEQQYIIMGRAL